MVGRELDGMSATIGARQISVTLPPGTVRTRETFVLTWSVVPMMAEELELENAAPDVVGTITEGFNSNVEFDVTTGPVAPCKPVRAATQ